jgi:plasmid stabilization system protein ParE
MEAESLRAAVHVDEQIADVMRRLLDFPESGRPGRIAGTRELVIPRTPYVATYRVDGDAVRILRGLQRRADLARRIHERRLRPAPCTASPGGGA